MAYEHYTTNLFHSNIVLGLRPSPDFSHYMFSASARLELLIPIKSYGLYYTHQTDLLFFPV